MGGNCIIVVHNRGTQVIIMQGKRHIISTMPDSIDVISVNVRENFIRAS